MHILEFKEPELLVYIVRNFKSLFEWLENVGTDPQLAKMIQQFILYNGWPLEEEGNIDIEQLKILRSCERIGKRNFLQGYIP